VLATIGLLQYAGHGAVNVRSCLSVFPLWHGSISLGLLAFAPPAANIASEHWALGTWALSTKHNHLSLHRSIAPIVLSSYHLHTPATVSVPPQDRILFRFDSYSVSVKISFTKSRPYPATDSANATGLTFALFCLSARAATFLAWLPPNRSRQLIVPQHHQSSPHKFAHHRSKHACAPPSTTYFSTAAATISCSRPSSHPNLLSTSS
jgi:hypothetical protein